MNYPLISEYVEAIKMAEDNFEELSYLRPVLDGTGQPVMSSGNFAVVFKMKDERDGKLYAVRCFHRDQEGREESYRLIEEELKDVESPYLVSFRYMDKELYVDSKQSDETEFPVLLMDWVEGVTLDKYLRENLDDQYALEMLAYRFSQLAQWLIPQPFAHGDLKPDNILVREDGSLVLVDYDGMYVPAMRGQKARELGSPDFRHPLRTMDDFDEHIDDFPLVSILLSLKTISLNPQLLGEYGAKDRLLLTEKDYIDIVDSDILRYVLEQISNKEIIRIYSLFVILLSEKSISLNSYRLVFEARDNGEKYKAYKEQSRFDDDSKYCLSCLLMNGFGCFPNISKGLDLIFDLAEKGDVKAQFRLGWCYEKGEGAPKNKEKAMEWYTKAAEQGFGKAQNNLGLLYKKVNEYEKAIGWLKKAANQGLAYAQNTLGCCFRDAQGVPLNYAKAVEWFTKAAMLGFSNAQYNLGWLYMKGHGVEKSYVKAVEWFTKAAGQGHLPAQTTIGLCYEKGWGIEKNYEKAVEAYVKASEQGFAPAQYNLGCLYMKGLGVSLSYQRANEWFIKAAEQGHVEALKSISQVTAEDLANAWTDEYGVKYSSDRKRLLKVGESFNCEHYSINNETRVICDGAFQYSKVLIDVNIPDSVTFIGEKAFHGCKNLSSLAIPSNIISIGDGAFQKCDNLKSIVVDINNPRYDSRDNCNAIIETRSNTLTVGCQYTHIPNGVMNIGKGAFSYDAANLTNITIPGSILTVPDKTFSGCNNITSVIIQNGVKSIGKEAFWGCLNLTNIGIPDGVTSIGERAFVGCDKLKSIIIPRSVTSIGRGAFSGIRMNVTDGACYGYNNLERIIVDIDNTQYDSRDNCNAIIETQSNTLVAGCQNTVIPNGITGIDVGAFNGCVKLTNIVIPGSVASIPDCAFDFCEGLTTVTLLNGIANIGEMAFYGCNKLSNIVFPDSITSIGERAFAGCDKLKNITIPHSVSSIGKEAFAGMDSLKNYQGFFNGRNNIESIKVDKGNAFYDSRDNCNAIIETQSNTLIAGCKNTVIPDGVKCIGRSAFAYCEELVAIEIPDGVTEIMDYAFYQCKSLKKVVLPNSIIKIGEKAFGADLNCGMWGIYIIPNICIPNGSKSKFEELLTESKGHLYEESLSTEVTEKDRETAWIDEYGVKYSAFKNRLLKAPDNIKEYTIRKGTKVICAWAFNNYSINHPYNLSSITIPDTITTIGEYAFCQCKCLTSITIPNGVTSIGKGAFSDCENLISVTIPQSVTSIESRAFSGCISLERIIVESGNPIYDSRENCNAIIETRSSTLIVGCQNTIIPYDVTNIGESAFSECYTLNRITIPPCVSCIGEGAFENCKNLIEITLFNGLHSIGKKAFRNCENLTNIFMPNSVFTVGEDAFLDCKNLKSAPIGENVKMIKKNTFMGCETLNSITIPKSIKSIDSSAFSGCSNLIDIQVDCDNPVFDSRDNCNAIIDTQSNTLIVGCGRTIIPNSVLNIANFALSYCRSLVSIIIPYSVKSIGEGAFRGCRNLKKIEVDSGNPIYDSRNNCNAIIESHSNTLVVGCQNTIIPESVKTIGHFAFSGCSGLTSIPIPNSVTGIGSYAFKGCTHLESIVLPNGVEFIENGAFCGCESLHTVHLPHSVSCIKSLAFGDCYNIFSLTIPNGTTTIEGNAFLGCKNLTTIILHESVTTIVGHLWYGGTFTDCKSLSQIIIPLGARSKFEKLLPDYKSRLIEVDLDGAVTADDWTDEYGVMYSVDKERLLKATKDLECYSIKRGTKIIRSRAFEHCPSLTTVVIPDSVTSIGEQAFNGCNSLSQIVIPLGTRIEIEKLLPTYKEILMEQDELEDLRSNVTYEDLANGVEDEEGVIYSNDGKRLLECTNNRIRNYEIQKGTKMICEGAFYGRKSLESITIPDSVTSIVDNPFRGSRISQISCQSLHYETDGKALYNKSKTHLIAFFSTDIVFHIPTSVVSVGVDAFCESEFLQSINLPDSVASIGDGAFAHCNSLQSIRIPDGVPCIGNGVFGMCYSLKFVHIPNSVTSIGKMAFLECVSLPSIHLPASVTSIGDGAFYECQSLQSIHIPDGITYIGKGAFFKCDSLQSIFIPQGTRTKFEKLIPDYVDKLIEL